MLVGAHDAGPFRQLAGEAVAQEVGACRLEVPALAGEAAGGEGGDVARGPDLTMWVGVAAAHHLALVLEYLDVGDLVFRPQPRRLVGPRVHHEPDLGRRHEGQGQIVPGGEAQHAAPSADRAGDQGPFGVVMEMELGGAASQPPEPLRSRRE